jgi:hypothetical protein
MNESKEEGRERAVESRSVTTMEGGRETYSLQTREKRTTVTHQAYRHKERQRQTVAMARERVTVR